VGVGSDVGVGSAVSVGLRVAVGSIAGINVGCGVAVAEGIGVGGGVGVADGVRVGSRVAVCEGVAVRKGIAAATSTAVRRVGSAGWSAVRSRSTVKMAPTTASGITIAISARESTLMAFPIMPYTHQDGAGSARSQYSSSRTALLGVRWPFSLR
jgi:hypothetical protein